MVMLKSGQEVTVYTVYDEENLIEALQKAQRGDSITAVALAPADWRGLWLDILCIRDEEFIVDFNSFDVLWPDNNVKSLEEVLESFDHIMDVAQEHREIMEEAEEVEREEQEMLEEDRKEQEEWRLMFEEDED